MDHLLPAVPIRLDAAQWAWINLGLAVVVREWRVAESLGVYSNSATLPAGGQGRDQAEFMKVLAGLASLSSTGGKRRQAHLDAVQLAAAIFGVRVARTQMHHGHVPARRRPCTNPRGLLRRLERVRKRAKRAAQKVDPDGFTTLSRNWRRFVVWTRRYLLFCRCKQAALSRPSRSYHRRVFTQALSLASKVLDQQGTIIPDKRKRQLVSDSLRHIRRARTWISIRDLFCDEAAALQYMYEYLRARLQRRRHSIHT